MANPYVNKVTFGNSTLIDLTSDTVTAADVASGKTFHDASGAPSTGTAVPSAETYAILNIKAGINTLYNRTVTVTKL